MEAIIGYCGKTFVYPEDLRSLTNDLVYEILQRTHNGRPLRESEFQLIIQKENAIFETNLQYRCLWSFPTHILTEFPNETPSIITPLLKEIGKDLNCALNAYENWIAFQEI